MRIYALIKNFLILVILAGLVIIGWELVNQFTSNSSPIPILESHMPVLDAVSLSLQLDNPDDKTVVFDQSLLVSGKTSPMATVIVDDDGGYNAVTSDGGGSFSDRITLDDGLNQLTITAFDDQGNSKTEHRVVYYSTEQL